MKHIDHIEHVKRCCDGALEATGLDAAVFYSGSAGMYFLDDRPIPFRANPLFNWWVPLPRAQFAAVVYKAGGKPMLIFHQPKDYWHAVQPKPDAPWTQLFDIVTTDQPDHLVAEVHSAVRGRVAFIGQSDATTAGLGELDHNPDELINRLHWDRAGKTEYELDCMARANQAAAAGHEAARQAFAESASEFAINLAYMAAAGQGADRLPYGNIVGLNQHAAVLHYQHQDTEAPDQHRSFLIDAGADFAGYAADVTRTYAANPGPFADLIEAMDAAQRKIVERVHPGVDFSSLHLYAHERVGDVLVELDIVNNGGHALPVEVTSTFFPHGLGHFIGLQTHDVAGFQKGPEGGHIDRPEDHPFLRLTRQLEAGHVVTIEPGLYFIPQLLDELRASEHSSMINWSRVEEMMPFGGVRIEDDVVVTKNGHRNLTREAFGGLKPPKI